MPLCVRFLTTRPTSGASESSGSRSSASTLRRRHARHARADEGRTNPTSGGHRGRGCPRGRRDPGRRREDAAILTAEGVRERDILMAEGEAQAIKTMAEAEEFSQGGRRSSVKPRPSEPCIGHHRGRNRRRRHRHQVPRSPQGIADGQATKIFIPADMSATLGLDRWYRRDAARR